MVSLTPCRIRTTAPSTNSRPEFFDLSRTPDHGADSEHAPLLGICQLHWSHAIDDASDGIDFVPQVAFPQDPGNLAAERSNSSFDTRQRFTVALNYDLPKFTSNRLARNGWQLNTIISVQTGRPIPIVTSNDTSDRFYFNQRPNVVPGVNPSLAHWNPGHGLSESAGLFLNRRTGLSGIWDATRSMGRDMAIVDFSSRRIPRSRTASVYNSGRNSLTSSTIRILHCRTTTLRLGSRHDSERPYDRSEPFCT